MAAVSEAYLTKPLRPITYYIQLIINKNQVNYSEISGKLYKSAITAQTNDKIANIIDNNNKINLLKTSLSFQLNNNHNKINLIEENSSVGRIAVTAKAGSYKYKRNDYNNSNNLISERVRSSSSENFLYGFVKNFVKIRQHDSDVSPRPRRPYQNDSSSRYYNKSDVTGQGRIIGDNNTRSVTSVGEGGGGRRQQQQSQQQYNNNQSDYIYNLSYNRSNTPPDPIKGGGGYKPQQSGSVRPSSPYNQQNYNNRQQQNFGNYNGQNNYYTSKYENGRQHGTNTNNGLSGEHSSDNQNGISGRSGGGGGYRNNNELGGRGGLNRGGQQQIVTENRNSSNNLESGNRSVNINNSSSLGQNQTTINTDRQTAVEPIEKENVAGNNSSAQPRRWVPPSLRPQHGLTQNDKNDAIFRKVRGILNKLTPEKFQELSDDLLQIDLNSTVVLNGVILLIFEKALDEPKYSSMYAQLCKRLSKEAPNFDDSPSPSTCTFLRLLLNVCRDKFLSRSTSTFGKSGISISEVYFDRDLKDDEITTEEEEKRHVAKQRMLGNVKFIGELSKLQMLSENVLHKCIQSLLDKKQRPGATLLDWCEDMECLCQLIKTCGKNLDTEQGKKLMEQYFETMDQRSKSPKYPARIRFMLRDIIELRDSNWVPRKVTATDGPVPIRQIRTDDDNIIRPPYINHRNRDMRHNDRDGDNWMNRFPLNLQPGFNDMFSNLTVGSSSPIMSPNYNNSNNNRQHNQRNNQNNHHNNYNNNRFNKHNNNNNNNNHNNQYNNTHNNNGMTGNGTGNNNTNMYNNIMTNKDIAPRFKRTLITTAQDPVENLQMRPAANSLLFKANMNIKTPQMLPISTPPILSSSGSSQGNGASPIITIIAPRSEAGGVIITPASSANTNRTINVAANHDSIAHPPEMNSLTTINSAKSSTTSISNPSVNNSKDGGKETNLTGPITKQGYVEKQISSGKIGKKEKGPNKEEFLKKVNTFLTENLILENEDSEIKNMDDIVSAFVELKVPEKFMKDTCYTLLSEILDKSESQHGRMIELIQQLRRENKLQSHALLDGFKQIINKMSEKEATIPRVTTHVASLLSRAVSAKLCNLSDIATYTDSGQHYPLILLVLQQLHKTMNKDDLEDLFVASKVDLISCLPEADRNKDRLAEILEDRNLTFLYPLLKVQAELLKQIQTEDNPQAFYKWIKANVDTKYHSNPGFINSLMTVILKHITQVTILSDGTDTKKYPDKPIIEKEEALLQKYCYILENLLNGKIDLQLIAIYALQVYSFNLDFPKGMLCRWFKNLYEANVIEEDAFFRWKEEISDEYPGKGTALFQVNNWLTWLEQAESEDED